MLITQNQKWIQTNQSCFDKETALNTMKYQKLGTFHGGWDNSLIIKHFQTDERTESVTWRHGKWKHFSNNNLKCLVLAETPTENFRDCQTSGSSASLNECSVLKIHQATNTLLIWLKSFIFISYEHWHVSSHETNMQHGSQERVPRESVQENNMISFTLSLLSGRQTSQLISQMFIFSHCVCHSSPLAHLTSATSSSNLKWYLSFRWCLLTFFSFRLCSPAPVTFKMLLSVSVTFIEILSLSSL